MQSLATYLVEISRRFFTTDTERDGYHNIVAPNFEII